MTVRKITKTTISVVILIIAFVFFRKYYIGLLSKLMNHFFHLEDFASILIERLFPKTYIGGFYPGLFYFSLIMIIIARTLDSILDQKTALKVLSPFVAPLIMTVLITVALCIQKINLLQLWGGIYLLLLFSIHSTFKRIIIFSESVGSYANLKLIKGFFTTIIDAIKKAISTGIPNFRNPIDEVAILLVSAIVLLLDAMVFVTFIVFLSKYWRLIFLAHLIG